MPTITFMGVPVDPWIAITVLGAIAWIVSTLIWLWIAYYILKAAIRDGIKESGIVLPRSLTTTRAARGEADLPDMRADR